MIPSPGTTNAVVPNNGIGMAFRIAGVPRRVDIANVKDAMTANARVSLVRGSVRLPDRSRSPCRAPSSR